MKKVAALALTSLTLIGCHLLDPKPKKEEPAPAAEPAAEPAPAPVAYVPPAPYKVEFGNGCTVGWRVTQEHENAGGKQQVTWAIVGDQGQVWQVEHVAMGLPADTIMGLTVNKADGVVTRAVLGKKGEAGVEHPISPAPPATPPAVEEDVTIKIGTFPAKKTDHGNDTFSWVGNGGDMNGVLLKMGGAAPFELAAAPSSDHVPTGNTTLAVTSYKYSNGMTQKVTNDRIVAAFFPYEVGKKGLFGYEMPGAKCRITSVGADAKPNLMW